MTYQIKYASGVLRTLKRLPNSAARRVVDRINSLADDPRPPDCRKLRGSDGIFRLREGNYRILYQVEDAALWVIVLKVWDRKDVYRVVPDRVEFRFRRKKPPSK